MNLTEEPELVNWPETYYAFVETTGPFAQKAPQAWQSAHKLLPELLRQNRILGAMSLYKAGPQIYRAAFILEAPPTELPAGLSYEKFVGARFSKFTLTGSYDQLPQSSSRVFQIVAEKKILIREDFCIENYVGDPASTPPEELITEILIPTL